MLFRSRRRRARRVAKRELHLIVQTESDAALDLCASLGERGRIRASDAVETGRDSELKQLVGVGVPRRSKTLESLSLRHGAEA